MPTKATHEILSSFYGDDTAYAASDTPHARRKTFAGDKLQEILKSLEIFCSKWRIGINAGKTKLLLFQIERKQNTVPNLWLCKEQLKYSEQAKFLGITFDSKLSFETHINDIVTRCKKRLNLLKSIRGKSWGACPLTILNTYKSFIPPVIEYSCVLFAHAEGKLLRKIQSIETEAIKIAYGLAPWTSNYWCYTLVNFNPILQRMKDSAKSFLQRNSKDPLIKQLIETAKPSMAGKHSPVFKALNH